MQAGRKRQWRARAGYVTADRVLLVVNSDVALSGQVADYYQSARGLIDHRLTFAAGAGTTWPGTGVDFYNDVVVPVAAYIEAHDIRAVLCSAGVPVFAPAYDPGAIYDLVTSNALGQAVDMVLNGATPLGTSYLSFWPPTHSAIPGLGCPGEPRLSGQEIDFGAMVYKRYLTVLPLEYLARPQIRPFGRIGMPSIGGAPAESEAATVAWIDAAIANEKRFADVASGDAPVWLGYHDRVLSPYWDITGYMSEVNRAALAAHGMPAQIYTDTYNADWPTKPADSFSRADLIAGTLPPAPVWAMVGSAILNEAVGAPYTACLDLQPGAWGYEATSGGKNLMINILNGGGCAAFGTVYEPFSDGVPRLDHVMPFALRGMSLAEIVARGRVMAGWAVDVWGDPLYRPFGRQFLVHH